MQMTHRTEWMLQFCNMQPATKYTSCI